MYKIFNHGRTRFDHYLPHSFSFKHDKLLIQLSLLVFVLFFGGGVMLNAQQQFTNPDFEQAPNGQSCEKDNIGLEGWICGSYNEGATCDLKYVCNGNRSYGLYPFNWF